MQQSRTRTDFSTEYIGQLEGEIAAKTAEANDLRAKNQALMTENNRLTDLTRMLLESPAFNSFLNEISPTDGQVLASSASSEEKVPAPKVEELQQDPPKDVNPHQTSSQIQGDQENAQVGMALIPETYYGFNSMNNTWPDNTDSSLYDAQVYAVTSVPEGPAVDQYDACLTSGKSAPFMSSFTCDEGKTDVPVIEHPYPRHEEAKSQIPLIEDPKSSSIRFDDSESGFDDCGNASSLSSPTEQPEKLCSDSIQVKQSSDQTSFKIVENECEVSGVSAASMERFRRFCAAMEGPSQRVACATAHLR